METGMKLGEDVIGAIKLAYHAHTPVLLIGRHGIGKSEILKQAADALKIGFLVRDLSLMEPTDLIGMPRIDGKYTVYFPPNWLPQDGGGLLVFEELNRCATFMQAPCLQLLTARQLNDYVLPADWLPVAVINPDDGNYETSHLDPALLSRFVKINVAPDRNRWLAWATKSGVHSQVLNYVRCDETVFDEAVSNPRAWKMTSDILKANDDQPSSSLVLRRLVAGTVGDARAAAFMRFMHSDEPPLSAEDVLSHYKTSRPRVQEWGKEKKLDLLRATLREIQLRLQVYSEYQTVRNDTKQWTNLGRFLYDLPGDLIERAQDWFTDSGYDFPPNPTAKGTFRAK